MEQPPPPFFARFPPHPRLAPYVRAFELFRADDLGGAPVAARHFPSGGVSLTLSFGDAPRLLNRHGPLGGATLLGPKRHADDGLFAGRVDLIHVNFHPGGAAAFFAPPVAALTGRVVALEDVWGRSATDAVEALHGVPPAHRLSRLERLLLDRLDERRRASPAVREAVRLIAASDGRVRIGDLAAAVNLSTSQLERAFQECVGLPPKQLARQLRCDAVRRRLRVGSGRGLAEIAQQAGYADQAHLAREFAEFIGLTPTAFARTRPNAGFLQDRDGPPGIR